jgi:nucleoside phosphorylase
MSTVKADPDRTFAVVVGIEKYDIPGADLDGPVRDACRFVRWLREHKVPTGNIHLFASPLGANTAELAGLDVPWQPARREPIFESFTRTLPGTAGDLLFLFWGGHGLLTAGERRLIYADASEVATLNLDVDSLLNSLRGDLFAGLPRQVAIIDACANHVEHLRDPEVFPSRRYQLGCEQFVLYGARPGEVAKNDGAQKSGVFSSAVLDELESQSSQAFPPNFSAVAEHLTSRFEELRKEGRTDQTPVFYRRQDWNGDSMQLGQIPERVGGRARGVAPMPNVEDEIRTFLRPLMGDRDSRRARLSRAFALYPGLFDRINLDGETGVFLSNLINTLREYGEVEAGKPAIRVLLGSVKDEVGAGDRQRIERISQGLGQEPDRPDSQFIVARPHSLPGQVIAMSQDAPAAVAPTLGILTALDHEFVAMKAMLDQPKDYDVPRADVRYVLGQIRSSNGGVHQVVLALGDMGESLAAIHGAQMLGRFPTLNSVLMVGIAGGVPNPAKPDEHVRLGDVVVSDRYGVLQYDYAKQTSEGIKVRSAPRPPSSKLLQYVRFLNVGVLEGRHPWEGHLREGLTALGWTRPADSSDFLGRTADPRGQVQHPDDPKRRPGQPRAFLGLIASSNILLKDSAKRDSLRDQFGAKAIEMETAGLADAAWIQEIGYLGIRGICDYCDDNKNDLWQPYAAMAAAAYVRALLESMPGRAVANP